MFYNYHKKNLLPHEYHKLSKSEKTMIKAFTYKELEILEEQNKPSK